MSRKLPKGIAGTNGHQLLDDYRSGKLGPTTGPRYEVRPIMLENRGGRLYKRYVILDTLTGVEVSEKPLTRGVAYVKRAALEAERAR